MQVRFLPGAPEGFLRSRVLPSALPRVREQARSTADRGAGNRRSPPGGRTGALVAAQTPARAHVVDRRGAARGGLRGDRRVGEDPAQLRRVRLARLGLSDTAWPPGPGR